MGKQKFLKVHSVDEGFGRINFKYLNEQGYNVYYCLQEYSHGFLKFYRCSQDGEPSHEVPSSGFIFQLPNPLVHGDTTLMKLVWSFINKSNGDIK